MIYLKQTNTLLKKYYKNFFVVEKLRCSAS